MTDTPTTAQRTPAPAGDAFTADRVARYHSAVRSGASFRRAAEACMALADEESAGLRQRLDAIVRLCDARDVEWSTDPGSVSTAAIRRLAT